MIRVGELVDQPDLRLEVLAGAEGLRHTVTWAHASDLAEPWDWLAGGELLMKNGRSLPRTTARQVDFLDRLAAAEASALVIGVDPETPRLGPRALRQADALSLPVLRVPYAMSFIVISRAVADASVQEEARRITRAGRVYATIQAAVRTDPSGSFLGRLEQELGHRVHVLDAATLRPLLESPRAPDPPMLDHLRRLLDQRQGRVPAALRLPDRGRRSAVAVEVPCEEPTVLVAERADGRAFDVSLLHHAATAASVEIAHASMREDFEAQVAATALGQLLEAGSPTLPAGPPSALLVRAGLDPSTSQLLALTGDHGEAGRRLGLGLRRRGVRHVLVARGGLLWALADGSAAAAVAAVAERLDQGASVGASGPLGTAARLPDAAREANWALHAAVQRGGGLVTYGEATPLPALRDPAEARALVDRVLGPILDYDGRHGTRLASTLASFLRCRRSWNATAAALGLHRQTVVYRMRRVSELTGRDLGETADLAELWLAVSAFEVLGGEPGSAGAPADPG